jgi:ATP-binding cassette, subfamily B, bacterial
VLDNGQLIEEGEHEALVAQNGLYAKLAKLQFQELQAFTQSPTI